MNFAGFVAQSTEDTKFPGMMKRYSATAGPKTAKKPEFIVDVWGDAFKKGVTYSWNHLRICALQFYHLLITFISMLSLIKIASVSGWTIFQGHSFTLQHSYCNRQICSSWADQILAAVHCISAGRMQDRAFTL